MVVAVVVLAAGMAIWSRQRDPEPVTPVKPAPLAPLPPLEQLRAAIQSEAAAQQNPWVLAHAMLALGPDVQLGDRTARKALDGLLRRDDNGPYFDLMDAQGGLGEVHPHLVLKVLSDVAATDPLCQELLHRAIATFRRPNRFENWNDSAWFLEALHRLGVAKTQPLGTSGDTVATLFAGAHQQLLYAQRVVEALLQQPEFRRPQGNVPVDVGGVWSYTCGGQHLLQAQLLAARYAGTTERAQLLSVLQTFGQRLDAEYSFRVAERTRAVQSGVNPNSALLQTALSLLKLLGHALETLAYARDAGIGDPAKLEQQAHQTRARLLGVLEELTAKSDLRQLFPGARKRAPKDWLLWFGDGCHALHGLRLWE